MQRIDDKRVYQRAFMAQLRPEPKRAGATSEVKPPKTVYIHVFQANLTKKGPSYTLRLWCTTGSETVCTSGENGGIPSYRRLC